VLRLIEALYGPTPPNGKLSGLLRRAAQLDHLDWSLLLISLEIELRVSLEPRLLDARRWTVGKFAKAVASLPKVNSVTHTIDLLALLVDQLLGAQPREPRGEGAPARPRSSTSHPSANHAPRHPTRSARRGAHPSARSRAPAGPARAR